MKILIFLLPFLLFNCGSDKSKGVSLGDDSRRPITHQGVTFSVQTLSDGQESIQVNGQFPASSDFTRGKFVAIYEDAACQKNVSDFFQYDSNTLSFNNDTVNLDINIGPHALRFGITKEAHTREQIGGWPGAGVGRREGTRAQSCRLFSRSDPLCPATENAKTPEDGRDNRKTQGLKYGGTRSLGGCGRFGV